MLKSKHRKYLSPSGRMFCAIGGRMRRYMHDMAAIFEGIYPSIPKQPAVLYALVSAMIAYYGGSEAHKGHVFAICDLLPKEFAVMLVKDLIVKDEGLATHGGFEVWLAKYGEYIIG